MSTERTERDLITGRFWFRESYGYDQELPKPEYAILFLKTILHIAGADGTISEPERNWVVGFAAVCGFPQNIIDELKVYQPGESDIVEKFFQDMDMEYVKQARCSILYYGIRAASADGELHAKELEAIYKLAKKVNVSDEQVQQIRSFVDEENQIIEKRAKTIFPDGLDVLLKVYDEKFVQNK
ncbi:unnamed protein product [Adineta steineri]|uniref:Co-chaperone DjlA N-terminal domain-containing protein n=1 Tax=Adineta steineri TaxID=433720 RepID=A0A814U9A6_9BILA|nr:unnamed protein product [Adineta steineri]CAF1172147.1 unnamed protein product [Adineta steineri]